MSKNNARTNAGINPAKFFNLNAFGSTKYVNNSMINSRIKLYVP